MVAVGSRWIVHRVANRADELRDVQDAGGLTRSAQELHRRGSGFGQASGVPRGR